MTDRRRDPVELRLGLDGVKIATYSDDRGSPELAQHVPSIETMTNVNRETRRVRKTQDLLDRMLGKNTISEGQHKAGRKFETIFYVASLNPTSCMTYEPAISAPGRRPEALRMTDSAVAARQRLDKAMGALGGHTSPAASAAWYCLGSGMTIKAWAARDSGIGAGLLCSKMNEHTAKGVLISALAVLAGHWRLR